VLALLAGEAVALSLAGGALGSLAAYGLVYDWQVWCRVNLLPGF
jgi:hypothetical protein